MNEEQLTRLRNRLQQRKERLKLTEGRFFLPRLHRLLTFLRDEPFFAPILDELESDKKMEEIAGKIGNHKHAVRADNSARELLDSLPSDEEYAAVMYHLLRGAFLPQPWWKLEDIRKFFCVGTHKTGYSGFMRDAIGPLCDYLDERLNEQQAILGLLVRYKKRSEWFNREELQQIADDEKARKGIDKKRAEVEKVLKVDLYRYLHDQGMDFTIEPKSDRGEIDLILNNGGYIEGKVFDNKGRDKNYIIKGFGQLLHYLRQYVQTKGYLLVYQTCKEQLVIEADQLGTIPFVRCGGKTVYILAVDICQYQKSVSQRDHELIRITAEELSKAEAMVDGKADPKPAPTS